jgi:hypothetical protein
VFPQYFAVSHSFLKECLLKLKLNSCDIGKGGKTDSSKVILYV